MHTRMLPALLIPALIASCNTTSVTADPLDLSFTATGTTQNYKPVQDAELSYTTQNTKLVIGTLKAGGTVDITMTAAQATSVTMRQLSDYATAWKNGGCDISGLAVQDTTLRFTDRAMFNAAGGTPSVMYPQAVRKNADGTTTVERTGFWYAQKTGSMKGAVRCPGRPDVTYDVNLQPGWNTTVHTLTTRPDGTITDDRIGQSRVTNTYDGPWYAYTATNP